HDDREAGVTIHWATEQPDAGEIIAQEAFSLERGESIVGVHERATEQGAMLLAEALDAIEADACRLRPEDELLATFEPAFRRGQSFVDFHEWDVERVWHVLAGLHPMIHQPLADTDVTPIRYDAVIGFDRRAHAEPPGSLVRAHDTYA